MNVVSYTWDGLKGNKVGNVFGGAACQLNRCRTVELTPDERNGTRKLLKLLVVLFVHDPYEHFPHAR